MLAVRARHLNANQGVAFARRLGIVLRQHHCATTGDRSPLNVEDQAKTGVQPSYGPIGVTAALKADPNGPPPQPTIFKHEFSLADRVGLVSGANRGLGLEMALALIEAGARAIYCIDLPKEPGEEWCKVRDYAKRLQGTGGEARMEYISCDVTDQECMWKVGETIGDREGRMDIGVAAAGVLKAPIGCLDYPAEEFSQVMDINTNGVLFTAQAAGRQIVRFGNGGSLILVASVAGSVAFKGHELLSYNTSKSAILQMARSMACELGSKRIRVNSLSPGYIHTGMTAPFLNSQPILFEKWSSENPLGRLGRKDELRGVVTWLASDAITFCTGSDIKVSGGHDAW
ncbi:sorbose reductase sou1 [Panus rudis PR-1116 ss-1]|nr:sorbose reductase sou1 [Panus rudis PR-1116 ss-1]